MSREEIIKDCHMQLHEWLRDRPRIYTVLRHVSRSNTSRSISLFIIKDNKPLQLDWYASRVLDYSIDNRHGGLKVKGCGMDMGFHLVYSLCYAVFNPNNKYIFPLIREHQLKLDDAGYWCGHQWL